MHEYGALKPVEVILRKGRKKRENNGGDEPNWCILYSCMEMSQRNLLYNYYILIKMFFKSPERNSNPV
jgi:hypothetical protein